MRAGRSSTPPVVLVYGLLGVIPFVVPPLVGVVFPAYRDWAGVVVALYAGLILSFLGGARWAFENAHSSPRGGIISVAMVPTLVALVLLVLPPDARRLQLLGLATALALHWLWDLRGADLPGWYARLRTLLTVGAVAGLVVGAFTLVP